MTGIDRRQLLSALFGRRSEDPQPAKAEVQSLDQSASPINDDQGLASVTISRRGLGKVAGAALVLSAANSAVPPLAALGNTPSIRPVLDIMSLIGDKGPTFRIASTSPFSYLLGVSENAPGKLVPFARALTGRFEEIRSLLGGFGKDPKAILLHDTALTQFCESFLNISSGRSSNHFAKSSDLKNLITAWRRYQRGEITFTDDSEELIAGESDSMGAGGRDYSDAKEVLADLVDQLIPMPIIDDNEMSEFFDAPPQKAEEKLVRKLKRALTGDLSDDQMLAQIHDTLREYHVRMLKAFFRSHPNAFQTFADQHGRVIEEAEKMNSEKRKLQSASEPLKPFYPSPLSWGGVSFHPDLRRYQQQLWR